MPPQYRRLCYISNTSQALEHGNVEGCLSLICEKGTFTFNWIPYDSPQSQITIIAENTSTGLDKIELQKISLIIFNESETDIILMLRLTELIKNPIHPGSPQDFRKLVIPKENILEISNLIECLILNRIAVPFHYESYNYSFKVYEKCLCCDYFTYPTYLKFQVYEYTNMEDLWVKIIDFFTKFMNEVGNNPFLSQDPNFSIGIPAISAHFLIIKKIQEYISEIPQYEPITKENFESLFDSSGKLKDIELFKLRVFHAGIQSDVFCELLPFVLGSYPLDSNSNDRKTLIEKQKEHFSLLLEQVKSVSQYQLLRNKKLSNAFRVITNDVDRTDRNHPAFEKSGSIGMTLLTTLLRSYCLYDFNIGYLQGMNDLFIPIIFSYYPKWDKEGNPIDDEGNILDVNDHISDIFWCYNSMMKTIDHAELISNVKDQCLLKAQIVVERLTKICPMITIWLKNYDLTNLLWVYQDFVLLYKRTWTNIWDLWLQMFSFKQPKYFLIYFITATIILIFPKIAERENVLITTVMDSFPKELEKMDPKEIGKVALWVAENAPIEAEEQKIENEMSNVKYEYKLCELFDKQK